MSTVFVSPARRGYQDLLTSIEKSIESQGRDSEGKERRRRLLISRNGIDIASVQVFGDGRFFDGGRDQGKNQIRSRVLGSRRHAQEKMEIARAAPMTASAGAGAASGEAQKLLLPAASRSEVREPRLGVGEVTLCAKESCRVWEFGMSVGDCRIGCGM